MRENARPKVCLDLQLQYSTILGYDKMHFRYGEAITS